MNYTFNLQYYTFTVRVWTAQGLFDFYSPSNFDSVMSKHFLVQLKKVQSQLSPSKIASPPKR